MHIKVHQLMTKEASPYKGGRTHRCRKQAVGYQRGKKGSGADDTVSSIKGAGKTGHA